MFRKFTVIITTFITSFFLLASPVKAEGIVSKFNFDSSNQLPNIHIDTQRLLDNVEVAIKTVNSAVETIGDNVDPAMETAEDIIEVATVVCIVGSITSTTILPPAAAILPYCSAIGILDGGNATTKIIKQRKKAWNAMSHVF